MKPLLSLALALLSTAAPVLAQSPATAPAATEKVQPSQTSADASLPGQPQMSGIRIPDGTPVDIEASYTINSMDFKANDKISFHVVNPVKIDGLTVIEQGATATARIEGPSEAATGARPGYLFLQYRLSPLLTGRRFRCERFRCVCAGTVRAQKWRRQ